MSEFELIFRIASILLFFLTLAVFFQVRDDSRGRK